MKTRTWIGAAGFFGLLALQALAHPVIHGGIRAEVASIKDRGSIKVEFVADRKAGQVRLYVVEEGVDRNGATPSDWVRNLPVREETVGKEQALLMPLPDPGAGKQWLAVPPTRAAQGFLFYRIELALRVAVDGGAAADLKFSPGPDPRGFNCLAAPLDLSKAQTIRIEDATMTVCDAGMKTPTAIKLFPKGSPSRFGENGTDQSLAKYDEAIAQAPQLDKFRKPEAPAVPRAKR